MYIVKQFHVAFVVLSLSGFIVRGIWMMRGSALLRRKVVRIAPHVNDTLLLLTGAVMAYAWSINPLQQTWLLAKLIALLAYIGLGSVALKYGRNLHVRIASWLAALLVFAYIIAVAHSHHAWPFS